MGNEFYSKINSKCYNLPKDSYFSKAKPKIVIAKGNSAASHNYWREEDKYCLSNITSYSSANVMLSNAELIPSKEAGKLPLLNTLSEKAKRVIVLPALKNSLLISLGQLCDNDYNV